MYRSVLPAVLVLGLASCTDRELPTESIVQVTPTPAFSCTSASTFYKGGPRFGCNDVVRLAFSGGSSSEHTVVIDAASGLNLGNGLPQFSQSGYTVTQNVTINTSNQTLSTTPFRYCGKFQSGTVTIYRLNYNASSCPGSSTAVVTTNLSAVAAHELGHAYGWDHVDGTDPEYNPCLMNIQGTTIHSSWCVLEEQSIYWAYSLRSVQPSYTYPLVNDLAVEYSDSDIVYNGQQRTTRVEFSAADGGSLAAPARPVGSSSGTCFSGTPPAYNCPGIPDVVWVLSDPTKARIVSQNDTMAVIEAEPITSDAVVTLTARLPVAVNTVWPERTAVRQFTIKAIPQLTSIVISPPVVELETANGRESVTATGYDQYGNAMSGLSFTWSIDDTSIANFFLGVNTGETVSVRPLDAGTTRIRASYGSVQDWNYLQVDCELTNSCIM